MKNEQQIDMGIQGESMPDIKGNSRHDDSEAKKTATKAQEMIDNLFHMGKTFPEKIVQLRESEDGQQAIHLVDKSALPQGTLPDGSLDLSVDTFLRNHLAEIAKDTQMDETYEAKRLEAIEVANHTCIPIEIQRGSTTLVYKPTVDSIARGPIIGK